MPDKTQDILTIDEAAEYLNLNKETIYKLVRPKKGQTVGDLPGKKVGNKWRFSRRKLQEWVEKNGK